MAAHLDIPVRCLLEVLRDEQKIPLGVLSFNIETESFHISLFPKIVPEEFQALLKKVGFNVRFEGP